MLQKFGDFLGTKYGFWLTMTLTMCTIPIAVFIGNEWSTYILSVIAIIIPSIILYHDAKRDVISMKRDKALHAKIDELIKANQDANDELRGIEPD